MTQRCPVNLGDYHPFNPAELTCPHASWAMLREEAPVFRVELPGSPVPVYLVTRRRELDFISQHTEIFSSNPPAGLWRWPELSQPSVSTAFTSITGRRPINTLQASDPPKSVMYRKLVDEVLSRNGVREMMPEIDGIVDELLKAIPSNEPVNFVNAFSVRLPLLMICMIMGMPFDREAYFRHYTDQFALLVDPISPTERAAAAAAVIAEGYKYLEQRILEYREKPGKNLLSAIANAHFEDGRPATMDECLSMAHVAMIAGNETSRNALSSSMYMLAKRPELWRRLKSEPQRVPDFVEELLRFAAPANTTPRTVMQDVEIGGIMVPKGACLFLMWGSGSRDHEVFAHAEEFDLDRRNKRQHTTFGIGVHFCAGLHLARTELVSSVTKWLREFDRVEFAVPEEEVHYDPIFAFHAISNLPIRAIRHTGL